MVAYKNKCLLLLMVGALTACLPACQTLPTTPHLPPSLHDTHANTPPTRYTTPSASSVSGYYPIATGSDAFAARSILTDMASTSIDIQYYIWQDDEAGILMLKDLWEAAERGVKVRLLLDDMNGNPNLDNLLWHFASHPNISVRLSNPAVYRKFRTLNLLLHPVRTNRRMHNKSMTFDGKFSIIGGRNIGNEYLNNSTNNFADLDVLLTGAVVDKVSDSFYAYWQSPLSYDIETLVESNPHFSIPQFALLDNEAKDQADKESQILKSYRHALKTAKIGKDLINNTVPFRFANITFLSDPADKLTPQNNHETFLVHQLRAQFGQPKHTFSIISSYFVPTRDGVAGLVALAKTGVKVQILTNSYRATDVGSVHAGYAHWRKDLLKAGIKLYELKATATTKTTQPAKTPAKKQRGQSTASLHAKAFAVDTHQVFIGSYNIDPRSANINSELGVIIADETLATRLHTAFNDNLLNQAYEVKLNQGTLEWHTLENGKPVIFYQEPTIKPHEQLSIELLSWLPIDGLL